MFGFITLSVDDLIFLSGSRASRSRAAIFDVTHANQSHTVTHLLLPTKVVRNLLS